MFSRREFLERSIKGSSLLALSAGVPGFLASTALAAEQGKDNILVVIELGGGNDGLNTVVPYADDLYHKARPTLRIKKEDVIRVDDHVGLNPSLSGLSQLLDDRQLAIVQGVGYPNPNRSHFESMDIWQTADPRGKTRNGWLGRAVGNLQIRGGRIPAFHLGRGKLPLAMRGSATGVPSINTEKPFGLDLIDEFYGHQPDESGEETKVKNESKPEVNSRKQLVRDVSRLSPVDRGGMLQFVRRTSLQTYATIDQFMDIMNEKFKVPDPQYDYSDGVFRELRSGLQYELMLVARMIRAGFGTRVFYVSMDGFDTHSEQREDHNGLLQKLGEAVQTFFAELNASGDAKRVVLMTFSEFGRRVRENGSEGTDHGSGSCLFVAGPAVRGGFIGKHPSLERNELVRGDLQFHTDFRQVYATLLDRWLGCPSRTVLGDEFQHVELFPEKV